ncbi:c-type cytochrome [Hydrogenophaga pseudoflava]|uniref:c-type cytochrome n=1 Tax=Hydrogenophaga pseudoflava TaxID=47421 RepID=UPI0027E46373|nr:cytochrome c [Hydrogenophaga pseudoflava]MDQ7747455.1 cytochrome c [Hydrogenophaga pseudoflava]
MKLLASLTLAAVVSTLSVPAMAQFQKPEDAIKYRKAAMTVMAAHFGRIGAMASERVPFDAKVAAENAATVEFMSKLPWGGFIAGSDKGETSAKPEIWTDGGKFRKASEDMMASVALLNAAAKTGNLDNLKKAFGESARTCKACHDSFRKE